MLKRITFTSVLLLLATALSAGEMYMWQDSEGVKHFSDRPPQRDEKAQVRGEVTTDVLKVDRRPPRPPVSLNNSSSNSESAPTQSNNGAGAESDQAETQKNIRPAEESQ